MFIAEIGLNHKGSETRAWKMLKELVKTDTDAVTFQLPDLDFYKNQNFNIKPLSKNFYKEAIDFVHKHNKLIGFAIKDITIISFLDRYGADFWKTLSTSFNDNALLIKLQKTNKPIFMSTGISCENDIISMSKKNKEIKFIHTQLSHNTDDVNLRAIERLRKVTNTDIAFGLHCANFDVLFLSIAFGPSDIFFYVKDNSKEKFLDHEHAIVINKLNGILNRLKKIKGSLGTGRKEKESIKI